MSATTAPSTPARTRSPVAPRTVLVIGVALAVAAAGSWWIASPKPVVSTDDAYLAADTTTVAPRVRGFVSAVLVRDNQPVKAGDPLVRIDPEEFDARVASAQAELGAAEASVQAARSALATQQAEVGLADAGVAEARTVIRGRDARASAPTPTAAATTPWSRTVRSPAAMRTPCAPPPSPRCPTPRAGGPPCWSARAAPASPALGSTTSAPPSRRRKPPSRRSARP